MRARLAEYLVVAFVVCRRRRRRRPLLVVWQNAQNGNLLLLRVVGSSIQLVSSKLFVALVHW